MLQAGQSGGTSPPTKWHLCFGGWKQGNQKHHSDPLAGSLRYPFGCKVFSDLTFCGMVCVCLDTILPPSLAKTSAGSHCSMRIPALKSADRRGVAGWHCLTHSNAQLLYEPIRLLHWSDSSCQSYSAPLSLSPKTFMVFLCLVWLHGFIQATLPPLANFSFPQGNPASREHTTHIVFSCFSFLCCFACSVHLWDPEHALYQIMQLATWIWSPIISLQLNNIS